MTPFVSIIIPHRNDSDRLRLCIESLKKQTYPADNYEIIVIDNGSDEKHQENASNIAKKHNIIFLSETKLSSYAARNLGIKSAKGDFLGFTDADCIPDSEWIKNALTEFSNKPETQIIGGKINLFYKIPDKPNLVELYETIHSFKQEVFINRNNYAATANLFTSKEIMNQVGNFNSNMKSNGDIEWCLRANKLNISLNYCKDVIVNHPARHNFKEFIKRQIRLCGGGFNRRKEQGYSSIKLFILNIFFLIPPVVTIYRVSKSDEFRKINSYKTKFEQVLLMVFIRYLKVFETFRLLLGYEPKNF